MNETFLTITGNVTAEPELRFGKESGQPFVVFRLAQNRVRWDREREQRVQVGTNYVEVVAFRSLGLNVSESVHRGDPVIVHGRLKVTDWDTGERRGTTVQVQADHIGFDFTFGQGTFTKVRRPQVPGVDPMDEAAPGPAEEDDADSGRTGEEHEREDEREHQEVPAAASPGAA